MQIFPRLPAEWEPHAATWLAWPHNARDWPSKFAPIRWVYAEIVRHLAESEPVRILIRSQRQEQEVRGLLARAHADLNRVSFFHIPTNRVWTRDYCPAFVQDQNGNVAAVRAGFNGWAKYPDHELDAAVPEKISQALNLDITPMLFQGRPFILEGGAIDSNGKGTLLTTEECLLDQQTQVRNPGLTRADIETTLRQYLGISNVLWLGRGIAGDDTHGHVDDLCRFVNPRTVVLVQEDDPGDDNYEALRENRERLESARLEDGSRPELVPLPMPRPLFFENTRLPASYANFYIGNQVVIVPTFNDPQDRVALGILAELFPNRRVVGVHAVDLVWGFGTLHCLTHEQAAPITTSP
ncbi:agmatine deiminase [Desulfonatronum thiosulfatophilum]|uniref:Agmatine deiminase n=1 Tax=Desulfonatronum thiosulfatophilum TaxID=617002 RepID=A0A1G6BX15_9BACT|nr:agmatine deiminase family protein [Desulfonatronum thiosulfatophilum]SDB25169.1 agmatine deiminase [Desulfonatronum thiosulfatophilum]